ncbi:MAG: hypothetical protein ACI8Y7_000162, partial [Candidatus Woesearchaeota archaeon]
MKAHIGAHKKRYKILLTAVILLIIILITGFFLTNQLHIMLSGDILITHSPSQQVIQLPTGGHTQVTTTITVEPFQRCDAVCTTTAYDISSGEVISKIEHNITTDHTYDLSSPIGAPNNGFGNFYVNVTTTCTAKRSLFCPATEKSTMQGSLYSVSYDLPQSHYNAIAQLVSYREVLDAFTALNASLQTIKTQPVYQNISKESDYFEELAVVITQAVYLWEDENYVEAQSLFSLISVQEIHTLVVTLNETYQKIEQYAQAYNRLVQVKPQL